MRNATLALLTVATALLPLAAQARPHDDDWRYRRAYDRYDDRYYDRYYERSYERHYPRRHARPPVVYTTPAPVYNSYEQQVSCGGGDNTLPTLLGGVVGGLAGSAVGKGDGNTAAIITGALLGGVLGSNYTTGDRYCTQQVLERVPVGQTYNWQNYQTGYDYTVTPTREYQQEGRYCREYQALATVGGRRQETYGHACMQPDGSWEIVD